MKRRKYGNVACNGYASKREAARAWELQMMEKAHEITELREQVRYQVVPPQDGEKAVNYIADFVYRDKAGNLHVEDVKGVRTPIYILKRKLMLLVHGIRIEEIA
jgi:hypothetical protein